MSKKAEYIETICKKLEACHYKTVNPDDVFSTEQYNALVDRDSYEVKSFRWLPEENLKQLAEFDWAGWASWERAYQEIGRKGYLKFTPYITKYPDDNPSLVVRHNRFLHMFRGYYFQTSMTVRGNGDAGHGSIRTDSLLRVEPRKLAQISKLYYMLFYAALIDCGFKYDSFIKVFAEDKSVTDTFLKESLSYWRFDTPYTSSDLTGYITDTDEPIIPMEHERTYEILAKGSALCKFYIDDESIGVEYRRKGDIANTCKILKIPQLYDGMTIEHEGEKIYAKCEINGELVTRFRIDEDDLDDFGISLENCFRYNGDKEKLLLLMLLKLCGIHLDWTCAYAIMDLDVFPRSNSNEVTIVESLNDVTFTEEEA